MNCQQCREDLAAYLDGLADEPRRTRIDMHLAECPDCTAGLAAVRQVVAVLSREAAGHPAVSLTNAVMDRILQKQVTELRRLKMRRRIRLLGVGGVLAVAVAFFAVSSLWITPPASARTAAEVMAQGAEATPATATVHLTGRMCTLPHDNFAPIGGIRLCVHRSMAGVWRKAEVAGGKAGAGGCHGRRFDHDAHQARACYPVPPRQRRGV